MKPLVDAMKRVHGARDAWLRAVREEERYNDLAFDKRRI